MLNSNHYHFYLWVCQLIGSANVAIGGSLSLMAQNDPTVPSGYKPGDIDLCISSEEDLEVIHEALTAAGYKMTLDIVNPYMFTVRRQYKKGGEKHDFFIVPNISNLSVKVNGVNYSHTGIVWAARGFYAGVGSQKAYQQLVDGGYVVDNPKPTMTLKRRVKSLIKSITSVL